MATIKPKIRWAVHYHNRVTRELGIHYVDARERQDAIDEGIIQFGDDFRVALRTDIKVVIKKPVIEIS